MRFYRVVMLAAAAMLCFSALCAEAAPRVDTNIFKWVQSSSRINYFFNQEQICFKVRDGQVDTSTLIVPVLKTYDDVQIKDNVSKRRWHMKSLEGFEDLIGNTEYIEIDLAASKALVVELDYIDSTWYPLERTFPRQEVDIESLSDKSYDKQFYTAIIDYASRHLLELALRTRSDISPDMQAELQKKQELYIMEKDEPEKFAALNSEKEKKAKKETSNNGRYNPIIRK